ncbi:ADP-ribosylglycohydrolase [compost metagenome]
MLGAIIGDVIGSVFEWHNVKSTDFNLYSRFTRFTDDTVMTVAVADALLTRQKQKNVIKDYFASKRLYAYRYRQYYQWFPEAGYGQKFEEWAKNRSSKQSPSVGIATLLLVLLVV